MARLIAAVPMAMIVITVVSMVVTLPILVVIFVFAVVVAVIVPVLFALFAPVEALFPAQMPAPIGVLAAFGQRPAIAEPRIIIVIDIPVETLPAVEPGAGADKHSADKPLRAVIANRRAGIGRVVVVTIRADRGCSNLDIDAHLRLCFVSRKCTAHGNAKRQEGNPNCFHKVLLEG